MTRGNNNGLDGEGAELPSLQKSTMNRLASLRLDLPPSRISEPGTFGESISTQLGSCASIHSCRTCPGNISLFYHHLGLNLLGICILDDAIMNAPDRYVTITITLFEHHSHIRFDAGLLICVADICVSRFELFLLGPDEKKCEEKADTRRFSW